MWARPFSGHSTGHSRIGASDYYGVDIHFDPDPEDYVADETHSLCSCYPSLGR